MPPNTAPHVVIVSRVYAPEPAAASFRLAALARGFVANGARVTVLTTTTVGGETGTDEPRVRVRRWPVLRDRSGYVRGYVQYLSFDVPMAVRLAWLLTTGHVALVVAEPPPTTGAVVRAICALARVPYAYYAADLWSRAAESTSAPRLVVRLLRAVEMWALTGARVVLSVNAMFDEQLEALVGETVLRVGNGVDTDVFRANGPARRWRRPTAVYAGTASEWQGAEVFARVFPRVLERVPDAELVYLGRGTSWSVLADAADASVGAIRLEPPVPAAEAAEALRGAHVALVSLRPGRGYDEAFPTKVYAAAACGTPVVFAGVGPARDAVRAADLGIAVDYDDEAAIADAMATFLRSEPEESDRQRRAQWAEARASLRVQGSRAARETLGRAGVTFVQPATQS